VEDGAGGGDAVSEVKRYDLTSSEFGCGYQCSAEMEVHVAGDYVLHSDYEALRAKLAASEAACALFLKDGETPAECITRWRADAAAVLELLRQEKVRSEKAEAACAQMREALEDCAGGLRYIRQMHGELYGVGWDRALGRSDAALSTDAGKGWVSTEGAFTSAACVPVQEPRSPPAGFSFVAQDLPYDWAGSEVYIIRKEPKS